MTSRYDNLVWQARALEAELKQIKEEVYGDIDEQVSSAESAQYLYAIGRRSSPLPREREMPPRFDEALEALDALRSEITQMERLHFTF